ncbi:FAD-dependent oxidoreductase [Brachionus plicatilis]|uniref:FAD-dependent oxidoreductase n=1 Tax=Brachionus plicatilis TaxID=10195 RepID=A0A3M7S394_BRAPC|nr:FAD-dependent oxidoreductase [Brachionus plicatilis]
MSKYFVTLLILILADLTLVDKAIALRCHVCSNCSLAYDENTHTKITCKAEENACGIEFVSDNTYSKTCTSLEVCEVFSPSSTGSPSSTLQSTSTTTTDASLTTEPFTLYLVCCTDDLCNESPVLIKRVPSFKDMKLVNAWSGYYEYNTLDQNLII